MNIKIKLMRETSKLPEFKTSGAAGMDLYADIKETIILKPSETIKVPIGFAVQLETGTVMNILGRSGNELKRIRVSHGTIDEDYRGEISVIMSNDSSSDFIINPDDRIAQATIHRIENISNNLELTIVKELSSTQRGAGGFGHTGK